MPDNPYAAPATFDDPPPIGRKDYPELDNKYLKRHLNNSHSISAARILFVFGMLGCAFVSYSTWAHLESGHVRTPLITIGICAVAILVQIASVIAFTIRPLWGWHMGLVCSTLMLFAFPLGTGIGFLLLLALCQSKKLFGPDRYEHKRLDAEWKYRRKNGVT